MKMVRSYWQVQRILLPASCFLLASVTVMADTEQDDDSTASAQVQHQLPLIQVQAGGYAGLDQGQQVYERDLLQVLPAGSGDISNVLKLHPNVQFDDTQSSGRTPGEIDPANISINGAVYWQNLFLLDGMSFTNDLDPVQGNPLSMTDLPGRSQGLALDLELVDQIEVLDSNISAQYGGFNGGVINVMSRKPADRLAGRISVQHSGSDWTRYHIAEADQLAMENSTSAVRQPEYSKWITRATLEGPVTDDLGLLFSFSRKESTIPLSLYNKDNYESPEGGFERDQQRRIDNFFLKAHWQATDDLILDASLTHAPQRNRYFIANGKDSGTDILSGGYTGNLKFDWNLSAGRLVQTLGFSDLENSRETETSYFRGWRWSPEKNWSSPGAVAATHLSSEGGWGNLDSEQRRFNYQADMLWNRWMTGVVEHQLRTGVELGWQRAFYRRPEELRHGLQLAATSSCIETEWCSLSPTPQFGGAGQAFRRLSVHEAGEISYETTQWSAYLEDTLSWGRLQLRPGMRYDADSFMEQNTWSPRLAAELDVWGDRRTRISAGANRYYGRNMHAYRLNEGRNAMQYTLNRANGGQQWSAPVRTLNNTRLHELKLPYDDELMLAIDQQLAGWQWSLKYVQREGKDQIVKARNTHLGLDPGTGDLMANYFTYSNDGSSHSETLTLTVSPLEAIRWGNTVHHVQLAMDWSEVTRSHRNYSNTQSLTELNDPMIRYNGQFMRYSERPADNFNRPWTARLTAVSSHPATGLSMTNFLRYRAGYRNIGATGDVAEYEGSPVDVWEGRQYKSAINWDMRLGWEKALRGNSAVFANLDIYNVLDKVNLVDIATGDIPVYETGREFWLELGYRF